jgi:hypothetical protein
MDEREPAEESEFVYRRIAGAYCDAALPVPIQREAFRPNSNDTSGLSVFRARFAQPNDALANVAPAKAKVCYVARLPVTALRKLGLSVVPDPVAGGPPGHALIPELNWTAYKAEKLRWKSVLEELARLASADIVLRPSD